MYACLTVGQFDDLERLGFCDVVSLADFESDPRSGESIVRAMGRYMQAGWVIPGECVETWRLTRRGRFVLECAFRHMDTMMSDDDSDGE